MIGLPPNSADLPKFSLALSPHTDARVSRGPRCAIIQGAKGSVLFAVMEPTTQSAQSPRQGTTTEQHRDARLDAPSETLAVFEVSAPLPCFAFRSFSAAALRNEHNLDPVALARCQILLTVEAAV
jgi:hypothetical protein